jgi:hypothetical protein
MMFSLRAMLLAVVIAAVFVAAFVYSSEVSAGVSVTLALALLVCGFVAIYLFPERRAFLVPAVIVGVTYGSAAFIQPLGLNRSLVTTRLLFEWWYAASDADLPQAFTSAGVTVMDKDTIYASLMDFGYYEGTSDVINDYDILQRIGHSSVAVVLAVIAGLVGSYVVRRRMHNAGSRNVQS